MSGGSLVRNCILSRDKVCLLHRLIFTAGLLVLWHVYRIPFVLLLLVALCTARLLAWRRAAATTTLKDGVRGSSAAADPSRDEGKVRVSTPEIESAAEAAEWSEKTARSVKHKAEPKRVTGSRHTRKAVDLQGEHASRRFRLRPLVFFSSLTGSTEAHAKATVEDLRQSTLGSSVLEPQLHDLSYMEYDDYFLSTPKSSGQDDENYFYLILVPTYNVDTALNAFILHLQETHHDFRIDTAPLAGLVGYSVFGFGDKEGWPSEEEGFCTQAMEIDKWMAKLTNRKRAFPLGLGDVKSDAKERLAEWREGVKEVLKYVAETGNLGDGVPGSGDALESDEEDVEDGEDLEGVQKPDYLRKKRRKRNGANLDDLEDIGYSKTSSPMPVDFTSSSPNTSPPSSAPAPKPMVPITSPTYAALTKQGYSIIGTHSGVKICRWTKSALRGRGSCYKRSFYGIASHLCMEATPSLSCSNKCVFCWRHGTNPVGTTWRWQTDPPELIFNGAKEAHLKKIKSLRGVPGVRAERFQEAMRIRHCALSLVGEPIFYPHINELLSLLHKEHISSFLVCNAQHPDHLAALKHVTQLYVSIDASNAESLKKIDRPLHRDYWARFLKCLDIIRSRRHTTRTVFRLTLVKGFNIEDEVAGYADLVERGLPCFIEIKGVTFCGTSTSAGVGLTMQNVPFYEEVCSFVLALHAELQKRGLEYGIAAEHAHSCCVLLADERFCINGKWRTLIDYERFFELVEGGGEFGPEDYIGEETPEWANWGRGGFDPSDERVYRKGKGKGIEEGTGKGVATEVEG